MRSATNSPAPTARPWLPTWVLSCALAAYWCALLVALHYPWGILRKHPSTNTDKVVHLAIYGLLAVLVSALVDRLRPPANAANSWLRGGLVVGLVAVQGALDELTQPLTGRTCDFADWVADVAGAIVAIGLYRLLFVQRRRHSSEVTNFVNSASSRCQS